MRKSVLVLAAVLVLGGGIVGLMHVLGKLPTPMARVMGGERAELINKTLSFLGDLKFKDFKKAGTYHDPEVQAHVDIPFIIQRVFQVKPEVLEVLDYEVLYAEIDDSGNRARVKTRTRIKALNEGSIKDVEVIYYFSRGGPNQPWYMKLEDSLRALSGEQGKAN